jgi:uncharacterized protein (TIGR03086 family)
MRTVTESFPTGALVHEVEALQRVYARLQEFLDAAGPDDMARSVPGTAWDVRGLLGHLVVSIDGFASLLRQGQPDWDKNIPGDDVAAALRQSIHMALAQWRRPGADKIPSRMVPGIRLIDVALADAVAHTWDLATALDGDVGLDDDVVHLAYQRWARGVADPHSKYRLLAPDVSMSDGATVLDRFLGLLGRTRPGHTDQAGAAPVDERRHEPSAPGGGHGAASDGRAQLQWPARAEGGQHHQRDADEQ